MWQKHLKISPIVLNAAIILLAGAALYVQKPEFSLKTIASVNYDQVLGVENDLGWEMLYGRVLATQNESFKNSEIKAENLKPTVVPAKHMPAPAQVSVKTSSAVEVVIRQAAAQYGVNGDAMLAIAACESGLRPNAVNGPYGGLFQFLASTWASNRKAMGLDPDDELRFDAHEAARTAAFKMARDGFGAWPVCGRKALGVMQKI